MYKNESIKIIDAAPTSERPLIVNALATMTPSQRRKARKNAISTIMNADVATEKGPTPVYLKGTSIGNMMEARGVKLIEPPPSYIAEREARRGEREKYDEFINSLNPPMNPRGSFLQAVRARALYEYIQSTGDTEALELWSLKTFRTRFVGTEDQILEEPEESPTN